MSMKIRSNLKLKMESKYMKKYLLLFIFLFIVMTGCSKAKSTMTQEQKTQDAFVKNMMEIVPKAKEGELEDYETCINVFFESLNNNDFQSSLKLYPIEQEFQAYDVKGYTDLHGLYKYSPVVPAPAHDLNNYFLVFNKYLDYWQRYYTYLFMFSNPEFVKYSLYCSLDTYEERLVAIEQMKNTKKYSNPRIVDTDQYTGPPKLGSRDSTIELSSIDKAMNLTEGKFLTVEVDIDNDEFEVLFLVGKIKNNWYILYVSKMEQI